MSGMVNFGEQQPDKVRTETLKAISRGDNKHGYQIVKQKDGSETIMSDKGAYYEGKRNGTVTPTVSMSEIKSECKLFDTIIECKGCGAEMLRRWSKCEQCGTER